MASTSPPAPCENLQLEEVFASPPFIAPLPERLEDYREIPMGIPPLLPDTAALRAALGGPPLEMMHVGRAGQARPEANPTPPPRPTLAEVVPSTFAGRPAGDALLRQQISQARATLSGIITAILAAEETLPEIFKNLSAAADTVAREEYFVLAEAEDFYAKLRAALDSVRLKTEH